VAFAVDPGGVEEVAAKVHRALEGGEGFGVVGAGPCAHAPHAVAEFANLPVGPSKAAEVHGGGDSFRLKAIIGKKYTGTPHPGCFCKSAEVEEGKGVAWYLRGAKSEKSAEVIENKGPTLVGEQKECARRRKDSS